MSRSLETLWSTVRSDRSLGSTELALKVLNTLVNHRETVNKDETKEAKEFASKLRTVRPEMTLLVNLGWMLQDRLKRSNRDQENDELLFVLEELRESVRDAQQSLYEAFRVIPRATSDVTLFSRSGVVLKLVENIDSFDRVNVLESHPGNEGISVANELSQTATIRFAYDAEATRLMDASDVVLFGADSFDAEGNILNKTGSRLIARASGETPIISCFQVLKYSPNPEEKSPTIHSPDELEQELRREHSLFELVEAKSVDYYVTDRGWFNDSESLVRASEDIISARQGGN